MDVAGSLGEAANMGAAALQSLQRGGLEIDELLVAAAYSHPVTHLKLKETHISWVVLTGPFAYKIKKSVRYAFIDASTLERRRVLCSEELRLNRRFAPDLYLDVVPIVRDNGQLKVGGDGVPVEFAVRMHEFDPAQELAAQLERNGVTAQDMNAFGAQVADLHLRAAVAAFQGPYGTLEKIRAPMLANLDLLRTHLNDAIELKLLQQLAMWTDASLAKLQPMIDSRRQRGMVRECHGDLHASNIVRWRQQWQPFDCLEFDPDLRWIDVISDTAFLFMDLMSRGRQNLAHEFLSRYLEETGDYDGLRLLPLYAAYLALVRAKVDALGAEIAGPGQRAALESRLGERLETAVRFMNMKPAALVIMHGVTASGKSWLSEQLVPSMPALRIRSDLERKRLAGVAPLAKRVFGVGEGAYDTASTQSTYQRLLACAESALEGRRSIIIDATFLDQMHREMFHALAQRHGCQFLIASCVSDAATMRSRLETRARSALDPSEATEAVLEQQLRSLHQLSAEERQHAIEVDTSGLGTASAGALAVRTLLTSIDCANSDQASS
ncbi:MAG: AAA family ATPase [Steroidobacteraceae bacterium]